MKNIKVLHIIPGYGGGISSYVKNLISGISNENIQMDVVSFSEYDESFIKVIELCGGKTFTIPRIHSGVVKMAKAYSEILRENQYDVVHCHISGYKGLFFMAYAKAHRVSKIFVHAHRTSDENKGIFYGSLVKLSQFMTTCFATDYFACSQMAAEFIFGKKIVDSGKVVKMPNSVNVQEFTKELPVMKKKEYMNELTTNNDTLKIGHIGRFNIQKNHNFMVEIIAELKNRNIDFVWIFVGEGELEKRIEDKVRKLNLQENVRFLGRREDVSDLIHIFDVFVLPSLFEGLPTVAIEAQTAGITTILADTITPETDMKLGITEYLSINNNADQWADCILDCHKRSIPSDEERIRKISEEGFTLNALGNRYEDILLNN